MTRRPSVDQQDLSLGQTLLMSSRAEEDAHAFLDKELKKLWRLLFLHYPQCSESQTEEEEEVDDVKVEYSSGVLRLRICLPLEEEEEEEEEEEGGKYIEEEKERRKKRI
ncbi:hypothetical protein CRUP_005583, partial [Coryphaenoides rupestris]